MKVKLLSRVRLVATPWTAAYQAPLSMGFSRQDYWNGLPFPSPRDLPNPGIKLTSLALFNCVDLSIIVCLSKQIEGRVRQREEGGETCQKEMSKECKCFHAAAAAAAAKSLQSCPTLCNPIDSSPPGSSVPGILQARTLEWVAISFSNA